MVGDGGAPSKPAAPNGLATTRDRPEKTGGLERERVVEIQRARLVSAMVDVCSEHGLVDATVARIVAHAGVSRRTFYEIFEDREECFLAAFDDGLSRVTKCVSGVHVPTATWTQQIRTALLALLRFLDREPRLARLLIVESLGAGPGGLERRQRVLAQAIAFVDEGRKQAGRDTQLPPLTAEGAVGGTLSIVHARLVADRSVSLTGLANSLVGMIVLPFLGAAAARRELTRPAPRALVNALSGNGDGGDPLRGLGMRLTYRTVRVLMALAAAPGSSNREVGEAAGIADQGQVSKLLGRLQRLGLVCNEGAVSGKGAPNAWVLTEKGRGIEGAMSVDRRAVAPGAGGG
jgi:AcrR family transcriptional regulator